MRSSVTTALFFGIALCFAVVLPITQDEAYYLNWSKHLDMGYFDHPPMVAWCIWLGTWWTFLPLNLQVRLPCLLLTSAGIWLLQQLYKICLPPKARDEHGYLYWGILFSNLALTFAAILATPDTPLFFFWAAAALLGAKAIVQDRPRWWLAAGACCGYALLSKYTALILGVVFLAAVVKIRPHHLRSPYLYLGGILAAFIFSPNLMWNMQHKWITWQFQLRHGMSLPRSTLEHQFVQLQPTQVVQTFRESTPPRKQTSRTPFVKKKPLIRLHTPFQRLISAIQRTLEFVLGQLAFYGFTGLWILYWRYRKRLYFRLPNPNAGISYLQLLTFVPILTFACFCLLGKVEANWAAMHTIGAIGLLACITRPSQQRQLRTACLINFICIAAYLLHSHHAYIPIAAQNDRILKETRGYAHLASSVATKATPQMVFADTYQLTAMLNSYAPELKAQQWPGLSRNSQFLDQSWWSINQQDIETATKLIFVTQSPKVPLLPSHRLVHKSAIFDCRHAPKPLWQASSEPPKFCDPIHRWYYHELALAPTNTNTPPELNLSKASGTGAFAP